MREVVDFDAVGEVADPGAAGVGVRDDYDFVATVDEFLDGVNSNVRRSRSIVFERTVDSW